ncbi:IS66 family insertion sequence element accessory protein TnpB [Lysinibacillus sp. NPDC086135]|uniref:IS66 family insertion sequence element accessory protein TnpB n=1 Tax=Lysinibacillus sp. NPDC086135 TaxID=3364130 RepID=UPI00382B97A3
MIPSSYFLERVKTVRDGFAILYKRLDNGKLQWPKDEKEVRNLSQKELRCF